MKRWGLSALLLVAMMLTLVGSAHAVGNCSVYKTFLTNEILTAADLNASFVQAATTNSTPTCLDDYSASTGQMQTVTDPFPSGAESLATSGSAEFERLRYQLGRLIVGDNVGTTGFYWYHRPIESGRANLLDNGSMEFWPAALGSTDAPNTWVLAGASATVSRDGTNKKHGSYAVALTRAGTDATVSQNAYTLAGGAFVQGRTFTLSGWVRATVANRARLCLNDGVGTTCSSYHTGGSSFERLFVTRTLSGSATALTAQCAVDTGDTTIQCDGLVLVEGYLTPASTFVGWQDRTAYVRVFNSGNQSISHNTSTALLFDSDRWDTSGFHDTGSNTDRLTIPAGYGGIYLVGCQIPWATIQVDGAGIVDVLVQATLTWNASITFANAKWGLDQSSAAGGTTNHSQSFTINGIFGVNPGDIFRCVAFHTNGATVARSVNNAEAWAIRLSP